MLSLKLSNRIVTIELKDYVFMPMSNFEEKAVLHLIKCPESVDAFVDGFIYNI